MIHKQLKLSGMHCVSCSMLIDGELEDIGVTAKTNYAKQIIDITFDETKTSLPIIIEVITKLGYPVTG